MIMQDGYIMYLVCNPILFKTCCKLLREIHSRVHLRQLDEIKDEGSYLALIDLMDCESEKGDHIR